jgi:hypothetical protein
MTRWENEEGEAETKALVESVATAIVNARGGRRGAPPIKNILAVIPPDLVQHAMDDARAAIAAVRLFDDAQIVRFHGEPT